MKSICQPFPGYVPWFVLVPGREEEEGNSRLFSERSIYSGHFLYCFITLSYHNQLGDKDGENTSPYVGAIMEHLR